MEVEPHLQPLTLRNFIIKQLMFKTVLVRISQWMVFREAILKSAILILEFSIHLLLPIVDQIFNQRIDSSKKRAYESRHWEVEHSTFTPLVFSATGHEATVFYKRLASLFSDAWKEPYAAVLGWVKCRLSFCLLRSAIQCIRGARSSTGYYVKSALVDLI